jgi:mRNA interferase MazF
MTSLNRFDIFLVHLEPITGSEIGKTRPCAVLSPDDAINALRTVIIAPLTSKRKYYKFRVQLRFRRQQGEIMLDQLRSVDKSRLINKIGKVSVDKHDEILSKLREMFS